MEEEKNEGVLEDTEIHSEFIQRDTDPGDKVGSMAF